jgi:hypothetical protein
MLQGVRALDAMPGEEHLPHELEAERRELRDALAGQADERDARCALGQARAATPRPRPRSPRRRAVDDVVADVGQHGKDRPVRAAARRGPQPAVADRGQLAREVAAGATVGASVSVRQQEVERRAAARGELLDEVRQAELHVASRPARRTAGAQPCSRPRRAPG